MTVEWWLECCDLNASISLLIANRYSFLFSLNLGIQVWFSFRAFFAYRLLASIFPLIFDLEKKLFQVIFASAHTHFTYIPFENEEATVMDFDCFDRPQTSIWINMRRLQSDIIFSFEYVKNFWFLICYSAISFFFLSFDWFSGKWWKREWIAKGERKERICWVFHECGIEWVPSSTTIIPSEDLIYCATVKVYSIPLLSRSCEQIFFFPLHNA